MLNDLVTAIKGPHSPSRNMSQGRPQKRPREEETEGSHGRPATEPPFLVDVPSNSFHASGVTDSRPFNPPSHSSADLASPSGMSSFPETNFDFALPVYSEDLGRLPIWPDATSEAPPSSTASSSNGTRSQYATDGLPEEQPMFDPSVFLGIEGAQLGFDPELHAIFSAFLPDGSFEDAFPAADQVGEGGSSGGQFVPYPNPVLPVGVDTGGSPVAGSGYPGPAFAAGSSTSGIPTAASS